MWFVKKYWTFVSSIFFLFFCLYKIYLKSAKGYKNADVHILIIKKLVKFGQAWKVLEVAWVLKTSDSVLKEIYGICETRNPTKEEINEYKMTEREIYEKFGN